MDPITLTSPAIGLRSLTRATLLNPALIRCSRALAAWAPTSGGLTSDPLAMTRTRRNSRTGSAATGAAHLRFAARTYQWGQTAVAPTTLIKPDLTLRSLVCATIFKPTLTQTSEAWAAWALTTGGLAAGGLTSEAAVSWTWATGCPQQARRRHRALRA